MEAYAVAVVAAVAEAAGLTFHLLDQPVGAFGRGVRHAGLQEREYGWPTGVDQHGECGHLGDVDVSAPGVEVAQPAAYLVRVATFTGAREQRP